MRKYSFVKMIENKNKKLRKVLYKIEKIYRKAYRNRKGYIYIILKTFIENRKEYLENWKNYTNIKMLYIIKKGLSWKRKWLNFIENSNGWMENIQGLYKIEKVYRSMKNIEKYYRKYILYYRR